jgi:hypothetical protein
MDSLKQKDYSRQDLAILTLRNPSASPVERTGAAWFLVQNAPSCSMDEIQNLLLPLRESCGDLPEWHLAMGCTSAAGPKPEMAPEYLRKAIQSHSTHPLLYHSLIRAYLRTGSAVDAFVFSSAALTNCDDKASFAPLQHLSRLLLQGNAIVQFNLNHTDYRFKLFTSTLREIDTAVQHSTNRLTDLPELELIRNRIRHCESIFEAGCLVGNDSVYFLKNLRPKRMIIADPSRISLEHTRFNLLLNLTPESSPEFRLLETAVGESRQEPKASGKSISVHPIDDLISWKVDLLKLPVHPNPMMLLAGATKTLREYRPFVLIKVPGDQVTDFRSGLPSIQYEIAGQISQPFHTVFLIAPLNNGSSFRIV